MTWRTLRKISHSLMVHVQVLGDYIHFASMYLVDHMFPLLPIKYLINEDSKPTMPYQLATGIKPSVLYLHVLFCPFVVQKYTAYVWTKSLNMCHQAQKVLEVSSLECHTIKKGILFTYHTNIRLYLCTISFFMRVYLVLWCAFHNHIQKQQICDR